MKSKNQFYDELKKRLDNLLTNPNRDNESSRHDLLIYPILTSEFGLNWNPIDLISQSNITVPKEVKESHIFREAIPKIRKPDVLICPCEILKNVVVVEEKKKQRNLESLSNHRLQLSEYQALYETTWGVLTDGEKWILKRNFETVQEFSTIDQLRNNIKDFRHFIGKREVLNRFNKFGYIDLVIVTSNLQIKKELFPEYENIPVIVCGIENGVITEDGSGYENYKNLREAMIDFPDLHPNIQSKRFTWASKEGKGNNIIKLRFETWKANDIYSN